MRERFGKVRRAARSLPAALAVGLSGVGLFVAGCAPEGLSRRYLAEESFWDAERYRDAFGGGARAIPTARTEIEKRYRRILARFRATPTERAADAPCLQSVNGLRGLAILALGHSALDGRDPAGAEETFRAILREVPPESPLAIEARLGIAQAAERREDPDEAFALYESLLADVRPGRSLGARALASFFPIPLYLADRRAGLGDPAGAESSLALGERTTAPFRAASEDSSVRSVAGVWLTEILLARGDLPATAALLEERASEAGPSSRNRSAALLLFAARMRLESGDAARARELLAQAESRADTGTGATWLAADRLAAELLLAEGNAREGEAKLAELLESGTGLEEEAAQAGVTLAEVAVRRGDWGAAVDAYSRVEVRCPLTEARVEASVQRARILEERLDAGGEVRATAARELLQMARMRPGIRRSELAEDGAALLLEEAEQWEELIALLEEIATGFEGRERAAAALVRAATACREGIRDSARADAYLARARREHPGALGALQAALLQAPPRPKNGQIDP